MALLSFQACAVVQYTVNRDNVPPCGATHDKQTQDYTKCNCAKKTPKQTKPKQFNTGQNWTIQTQQCNHWQWTHWKSSLRALLVDHTNHIYHQCLKADYSKQCTMRHAITMKIKHWKEMFLNEKVKTEFMLTVRWKANISVTWVC